MMILFNAMKRMMIFLFLLVTFHAFECMIELYEQRLEEKTHISPRKKRGKYPVTIPDTVIIYEPVVHLDPILDKPIKY